MKRRDVQIITVLRIACLNFRKTNTPSSNYSSGGSSSYHSYYSSDLYDVDDYDNPDDFADELADEFGDGDYDDGYDNAYDYWEDERD